MTLPTAAGLERLRPPRVHITCHVATGGAIEKRELPFIVGILADLSGLASAPPCSCARIFSLKN